MLKAKLKRKMNKASNLWTKDGDGVEKAIKCIYTRMAESGKLVRGTVLTFAEGREQKVIRESGTGVVAHEGDPRGVAAERADVLAHPRQAHGDVVEREVAAQRRVRRVCYWLCPQEACSSFSTSISIAKLYM